MGMRNSETLSSRRVIDNGTDVSTAEKRPSSEGLVDNVDPHESQELDELPKYEAPAEPVEITLAETLVTSFWVVLNTISTIGIVFLSKR